MIDKHAFPPIPPIEELLLVVFTHRSVASTTSNYEFDRLAFLGERVMELAITDHLVNKTPMLTVEEIDEELKSILSDENHRRWIDGYDLGRRLTFSPDPRIPNPLDSPQEMRKFFQSYVGAVFRLNDMGTIARWIIPLIDPDHSPAHVPKYSTSAPYSNESPPTYQGPPVMITLASFHEQAIKNGCHVTYQASSEGLSHLPIWTIICFVNGEEQGRGVGKNQKIAKEEAARKAFTSLGW
ncbi:hypothetical protein K435DRAFT_864145 [Dendrothele bispora CBS 962.96]|uniref:Uncharacterized protein n=1 Tax=Dendrothele bispora (strain CBS 962.96) TaxID=1314807 RepID=A0A4S8LN11_DENBC|nr:hypothetical protein K435DRAFT_864145 [Dendrothele bispora CBS 962.96]